jgi:predicted DsbA family dithiol-disulfide isomerase
VGAVKALVFCDLTDPWSFLGATRFERSSGMFEILTGEPVEIGFRARLVDPEPAERGRPLVEAMAARLGDAEAAQRSAEQMSAAARISGIELNLAEAIECSGFDAARLLAWAADVEPGVQSELAHQIWRAHLLEGADVDEPFVLASRAALVGLDLETADALLASDEYADVVRMQDETARSIGARQVPHVVVEHRWTLAGVQSQDDYLQALHQIHGEWKAERDAP